MKIFKKKKKTIKSKVKAGEPLSFYETETLEVIKNTVIHKGIAQFCCKKMEKACNDYNTGETERYSTTERIADSVIHNKQTNKIGMNTHSCYDYDSLSGGRDYYNYIEFNNCPFCGTKINGYIEVD